MFGALLVKLQELKAERGARYNDDGDHCCVVCGVGYGPNLECACEVTA